MSLICDDSATVCKQWKDLIFSKLAIHVVHISFLFTVVTHQHTSEQLNFAFPSLPGSTDFLTQSFPAMAQSVCPALTGPSVPYSTLNFNFQLIFIFIYALPFCSCCYTNWLIGWLLHSDSHIWEPNIWICSHLVHVPKGHLTLSVVNCICLLLSYILK